jgi:hypothetical protein
LNAERLLGDVQRVHSRLVAQIERVERAAGGAGSGRHGGVGPGRSGAGRRMREGESDDESRLGSTRRESPSDVGRVGSAAEDDGLEVPEFIPPS